MSLDPRAAVALASQLSLLDQVSGTFQPFLLNEEQIEVLHALIEHERVIALKARQQGISTIACLFDLLFAITHPGQSVGIVADTADKSAALLGKIAAWCRQLGIALVTENVKSIVLPNGSTIDALSAVSHADQGESRTGRSKSYGMLHLSELAFWNNDDATLAALLSTALPDAKVIIESTASPAENAFRRIWDGASNGWHHIFLSVERHGAYQAPPESISDDEWTQLQADFGFSSRPHAAWWAAKLRTDLGGDRHRALREYPILASQAFSFAEGRWIHAFDAIEPVRSEGHWRVYQEKPAFPVVMGVDTGAGKGADYSAVAILCQKTGATIATWVHNRTEVPDFLRIVEGARATWKPIATVIESNGIGTPVFQGADRKLGRVAEQASGEAEKEMRMPRLREAIETSIVGAGPEMQAEIASSVVSMRGRRVVYTGRDDLLNATSFALMWRDQNPYRAPVVVHDPGTHFIPFHMRKKRKSGA